MSTLAIRNQVSTLLDDARDLLAEEITGAGDVCITLSFQAEGVLLARLAIELDPDIPILFVDTGYHFKETYEYRDRLVREWGLNLINLEPQKSVEEHERQHGLLYRSSPDECCRMRKVEPLFKAMKDYRVWITGLRREQAKTRAGVEQRSMFTLPSGDQVLKLAPLTEWTTRDVYYAAEQLDVPLHPLYELGYTSIGCEPCTTLPLDPNDPRSGRWGGRKVECGIHVESPRTDSKLVVIR